MPGVNDKTRDGGGGHAEGRACGWGLPFLPHFSPQFAELISGLARLARPGAEPPPAPVRRPTLTCLQMFSPEPRTQQRVAKGKTRMLSPLQSPGDEGRPARQGCGVLRAVGGKRPQAGARGKCQHPTPGSFRAKEAVPPRPPSTSTPGWRKPPGPGLWTPAPSLQARRDGGFGARHSVCCEDGRIRAGRAQPSLGEPKLPSPSPWVVSGSVQLRATPGETEPRRQLSGERALTHPGSRARIGPGAAGL